MNSWRRYYMNKCECPILPGGYLIHSVTCLWLTCRVDKIGVTEKIPEATFKRSREELTPLSLKFKINWKICGPIGVMRHTNQTMTCQNGWWWKIKSGVMKPNHTDEDYPYVTDDHVGLILFGYPEEFYFQPGHSFEISRP